MPTTSYIHGIFATVVIAILIYKVLPTMMECGPIDIDFISCFSGGGNEKRSSPASERSCVDSPDDDQRDAPPSVKTKTIYLIRHAESNENHRLRTLSESFMKLGKLSFPTKEELVTCTELINVKAQIDSNLSDVGKAQVAQLGKTLRAVNFLEDKDIQLVAHSPLIRARQTSHGMLGCVTRSEHAKLMGDESWKGEKADCVPKVVELPELAERTIFEWVPIHHDSFMERISLFEKWLDKQPEERIAIVGHSQYFKSMLELPYKFENCDVWELKYNPSGTSISKEGDECKDEPSLPRGWNGLKLLHRYKKPDTDDVEVKDNESSSPETNPSS